MKRRPIMMWVLAIAVALWVGWSARTVFDIDDCLDAGGRWSVRDQCESRFSEM
jgi:hypothetical protein